MKKQNWIFAIFHIPFPLHHSPFHHIVTSVKDQSQVISNCRLHSFRVLIDRQGLSISFYVDPPKSYIENGELLMPKVPEALRIGLSLECFCGDLFVFADLDELMSMNILIQSCGDAIVSLHDKWTKNRL